MRLPIPHTWQVLSNHIKPIIFCERYSRWHRGKEVNKVSQSQQYQTGPRTNDGQQNNAIEGSTKKQFYSPSSLLKSCLRNSPLVNQATDFQFKQTVLDIAFYTFIKIMFIHFQASIINTSLSGKRCQHQPAERRRSMGVPGVRGTTSSGYPSWIARRRAS